MKDFETFNISKEIKEALKHMGFEEASPIQQQAIPIILNGDDVLGQAQTGTGKTAAFGVPMVEKIQKKPFVQALVLTPTRELAIQVAAECQKIAKFKSMRILPIYGGQSIEHQIRVLKQGVQIVIGTPGRILDHLKRKTLRVDRIHTLVLDEADEMLNMGFIDDLKKIMKWVNKDRQTLLFSATMPKEIKQLALHYMDEPKIISLSPKKVTAPSVHQMYFKTMEANKLDTLCRILDSTDVELGIIFCRTKKGVAELTEALQARGYLTDGLHGDLTQTQRDHVMQKFRDASIEFLIATDVAARGIDVEHVTHVINYDIPHDPESYVHRIGRTGRAGRTGEALTLVTPAEMRHLRSIEDEIKMTLKSCKIPTMEEVAKKRYDVWKQQITDLMDGSQQDDFLTPLVNDLLTNYEAKDVVSSLLRLAFISETVGTEEIQQFGDTGAEKGMVRFFLNVGRNVEFTPKNLSETIANFAGVSPKQIGKINIFEKFSFVEIQKEVAPFVYEAIKHSKLNGYRIFIEPAKPRERAKVMK